MTIKQLITIFLFLFALSLNAQDLKHLTSTTRYQDEELTVFKKRVVAIELAIQREMLEEDSPTSIFLSGGYDFRWLTSNNIYLSVGPRAKLGWLGGSNGYDSDDIEYVGFNTFGWGFSAVPSIGIVVEADHDVIIYLEGELGLLNYHARSSFGKQNPEGKPRRLRNKTSYAKPFAGIRLGLQGNVSGKRSMAVWVGLNSMKTSQFLDKMNLNSFVDDQRLDGEIGLSFKF